MNNTTSPNDALLQMFFDDDFVPQAYVDLLLSSFQPNQTDELKSSCSALLSRIDYYGGNIARELESTIHQLQKPAELVLYVPDEEKQGTTKLEYYLDTLANSVNLLESDVKSISGKLEALNREYESSNKVAETLSKLMTAKDHLLTVKHSFDSLKTIIDIAIQDDQEKLQNIPVEDFKVALETLQETISTTLKKRPSDSTDLLHKIDAFIELKHVLKGVNKFYLPYAEFAQSIKADKDEYLNGKNLIDEL